MKSNSINARKPPVIVFGLDTNNGLQTARILAQYEIPVIGIAKDPEHYYCTTNVCEEIIFTDTESDELVEALEALGPRLEQKAVLVPCNDMNVLPVSRNRQRLEKWYRMVLPAPDVVELLINKTKFYAYALQEGLRIPNTYFLKSRAEAERAAQELVFPCITKPAYRSKEWDLNNEKAYRSENARDFLALYDRCAKWSTELVVQEWVEGSDSTLYLLIVILALILSLW